MKAFSLEMMVSIMTNWYSDQILCQQEIVENLDTVRMIPVDIGVATNVKLVRESSFRSILDKQPQFSNFLDKLRLLSRCRKIDSDVNGRRTARRMENYWKEAW